MMKRRDFLRFATATALSSVAPSVIARPTLQLRGEGERVLRLHNIHTGETQTATYWAEGDYIPEELAALDRLLRDHRSRQATVMDRQLYDLLYVLQQKVDKVGSYEVISGYRSAATNNKLRSASNGVAKRSLHMRGKAVDIRLPGVELKQLRAAALGLRAGGVGYYPKSNFLHIDTGRYRFW